MADSKNKDTIQQYVGDMVSLESHIEEALDGQLKEPTDHARAKQAIDRFHVMVRTQRDTLKDHLKSIGGSESHPVKDAVADLFGAAAGVINNMRTKGISKSLRDNYTAFNHAAIGYAMLHTTAHALGDKATMALAERHMRSYAEAAQEINQIIADVTVWELAKEPGLQVDRTVAEHCTGVINETWRETSPSHSDHRAA